MTEQSAPNTPISITTLPNFRNEKTDDKHLFRVIDRSDDWTHYFQDEVNRYLPAVNHIIGIGFPKGMGLMNWMKKMTEEESEKILKSASERGSKVHAAIRDLISGKQVVYGQSTYKNEDGSWGVLSPNEWDYILSWVAWAEVFKPHVLKHETAVWNKKFGYAGTVDFIGTITIPADYTVYIDGKKTDNKVEKIISCLLDWKTSGGIYDDYKLQTAAYAACLKTSPKLEFYTGVVRLGTKHKNGGFEIHLWSRSKTIQHFKQFLQTKDTYHFITGKEEWKPVITYLPAFVSVDVPQLVPVKKEKKIKKPVTLGVTGPGVI